MASRNGINSSCLQLFHRIVVSSRLGEARSASSASTSPLMRRRPRNSPDWLPLPTTLPSPPAGAAPPHPPLSRLPRRRRHFSGFAAVVDDCRSSPLYSRDGRPSPPSSAGPLPAPPTDGSGSLHSSVHHIIGKIPVGKMTGGDVSRARSFISIVSKWNSEKGAELAEALLERMQREQLARARGRRRENRVMVDSEMYNICMDAWCRSGADGETIVRNVEALVRRMEERYFGADDAGIEDEERNTARPDRFSYNCLINAHSKREGNSPEEVEGILDKMNAMADAAASSDCAAERVFATRIRPDAVTYNSIMNYHASRTDAHMSAKRAEDLLHRMTDLSRKDPSFIVDTESFNIELKAWSKGGGMHGARRAEMVLRWMIDLHGRGNERVRPDGISFSTVIAAYSRVDPEDAPEAMDRAMGLLDELEGSYFPDSEGAGIRSCYNAAANVVAKSGVKDAVERVRALMARMKNMDEVPDGRMHVSLIEAYARVGSDGSFQRGKELLLKLMESPDEAHPELNSVVPFNILLDGALKGNSHKSLGRAEEVMALMEEIGGNARPDLSSYSMIISALSRSSASGSETKAVNYLRKMLKSYRNGCKVARPDSFVFNCVISMLARSKGDRKWSDEVIYKTLQAMENQRRKGNASVIPDTITYNLVIGKLAQTSSTESARKVMKLLSDMERSNDEAIAPDIITYTIVVGLQGKVSPMRAADVASSCVRRMTSEGMRADRTGLRVILLALSRSLRLEHAVAARSAWEHAEQTDTEVLDRALCNLVLVAYGRSGGQRAADGALSFLSERIRRRKEEDDAAVLPTVIGFGAALSTLGGAGRTGDALRLLEIMKALSREGVPDVEVDEGCYASILGSLSRSGVEDAASEALRVIQRTAEDLGRVSTASLNAAINACSRRSGYQEDAEAAFEIFRLGRKGESCNEVTFGLMIRTCMTTQISDDARLKLVEPLFKLCAKSGLVGNMVMRELKHIKKRLVVDGQLPKEWSINASDK